MTLTPEDIERQVFSQEFRGYDRGEVDAFLDRVADRILELGRERDALATRLRDVERMAREQVAQAEAHAAERIADVERRAAGAIEAERLLKRTLVTAQRTADETVAEARARAEEALVDAREKADGIVAESQRQAEEIVGDARYRAMRELEAGRVEMERVRRAVADLERFRSEYRQRVRTAIAEQVALIDRAGDIPDLPQPLVELGRPPDAPVPPPQATKPAPDPAHAEFPPPPPDPRAPSADLPPSPSGVEHGGNG